MSDFKLRFWGVRGTMPVADKDFLRYGGNTSCVEVRCGNRLLVLDAGTGAQALGRAIGKTHFDLLFSHTHLDHICGLPFFAPAYDPDMRIDLWAGHLKPEYELVRIVSHLMASPIFPISPLQFNADMHYHDFNAGSELKNSRWQDAGIIIHTLPLGHPDRATGYRISHGGKSLCYITDVEHVPGQINMDIVDFVKGTDCLIYDSTYADEEFERYKGWGHSTWQEAARIADKAGVKRLLAFHHDPEADDDTLHARNAALKQMNPQYCLAQEQLEIVL